MQKDNDNLTYMLVADSGSTKTAWCLVAPDGKRAAFQTPGINPVVQDDSTISGNLQKELLPRLNANVCCNEVGRVYFYGAGCIPSVCGRMEKLLGSIFPQTMIQVESDLLGAARALCGHEAGIACILGTGSNSCFYDGSNIVQHVPPLGYILGDEGSGATLGKRLVGDLLKGILPAELLEMFTAKYGLSESDIIHKVYREPNANRFLASLVPFLKEHIGHPGIRSLTVSCFEDFFRRNVNAYGRKDCPVHFTGSIAFHFREELEKAASACGSQIGKIVPEPIENITDFHLQTVINAPGEGLF